MKRFLFFITLILISGFGAFFYFTQNKQVVAPKTEDGAATPTEAAVNKISPLPAPEKISSFKLPILMYHYIRDYQQQDDPIGVNLSVSPTNFESQMRWLAENNFQTVGLDYFANPVKVYKKPIILTFDDGYQDAYVQAFPILKKYDFQVTFYLIVNKIGTPGYLTWDEIQEMKTAGMNFDSHTLTHPDLTKISQAQMENEIAESQKILSEKISTPIKDFCYPSGKYNKAVENILKKDGYTTAVTTASGIDNEKSNFLEIKRLRITNNTSFEKLHF